MTNRRDIDILAKTLDSENCSRVYYLAAKGKYRNPFWEEDRSEIDVDLFVAIVNNNMIWTSYNSPYTREDAEYVMGLLKPPYFPIQCDRGTKLLTETIHLRTIVTKTLYWQNDYSNEEAEEILRKYAEGFKHYMETR